MERTGRAAWQSLMRQLLHGRRDPSTAVLTLGYGEQARRLYAAPATLAELRRSLGLSEGELRRLLQAGLVLGLLRWVHKS